MQVLRWISRIGSISKWPPHWKYYVFNAYISHEQVHFAFINTYHVFLNTTNTIGIANTYCSIARVQNRSTSKMQNCFSFFLLVENGQTKTLRLLWSSETNDRNSYTLKSPSKRTEWAPATSFQPSVILLVSDRLNTAKCCNRMHLHHLSLSRVTEYDGLDELCVLTSKTLLYALSLSISWLWTVSGKARLCLPHAFFRQQAPAYSLFPQNKKVRITSSSRMLFRGRVA